MVPSLLANCAPWLDVKQQTGRHPGTAIFPHLATSAALGLTRMNWRLLQEKVLFLLPSDNRRTTVRPSRYCRSRSG